MSSAEASPEIKPDYEVVTEFLAEARIEHNLSVLDGGGVNPVLEKEVEYWTRRARELAQSVNQVVIQ